MAIRGAASRALWIVLAAIAHAGSAGASGRNLAIRVGHSDWPTAIAALQADTGAQGRTIDVTVIDDGEALACGDYTLTLDDVSAGAFVVIACNPATRATRMRLAHREALFGPGALVPEPLIAGVSVVEVRHGGAAGGAEASGAGELGCQISVRPYLPDLLHGTRLYLTPADFELRVIGATATSDSSGTGWTLHGGDGGGVAVEYEVVNRATQRVVVHDRASLQCSRDVVPEPFQTHDPTIASLSTEDAASQTARERSTGSGSRVSARDVAAVVAAVAVGALLTGVVVACVASGNGEALSGLSGLGSISF